MDSFSLDLPGGNAEFYGKPDLGYDPDYLFESLYFDTNWEQRSVFIYGKEIPQPRFVSWYSDYSYKYAGLLLEPKPFTPLLQSLCENMELLVGTTFNGVLLNLYQDGQSSIGMHADDEPEFGKDPIIASLSLGDTRRFDFQRKDKSLPKVSIDLTHGSVLVMSGKTQENWKHGIAKTREEVGRRINLTFRYIVNPNLNDYYAHS